MSDHPHNVIPEQQPLTKDQKNIAVFLPEERSPVAPWQHKLASKLRVENEYFRVVLAEFLGTFVLVAVGVGCIAQTVLSKGSEGNVVTIAFGWGLAICMGVYCCGGVSGGHINPAFTTAMVVLGRVPVRKMPFYFLGQYAGALFGSVCVFLVYLDALKNYDGGVRQTPSDDPHHPNNETAGIWATYPKPHVSTEQGLLDQVFATGMLVLVVMAVTDERNMGTPKGLVPLVVGICVTGLLTAFIHNCGAALNPARDLAPRVFTAIAGWNAGPFQFRGGNWFWVPVVGTHLGAIVGALFYNICIGLHWPNLHDQRHAKYAD